MKTALVLAVVGFASANAAPGIAAAPPDTVHNVGVGEILAPRGSVDSGVVIHPSEWVWNFGNQTASFPVEFRIDSLYSVYCCTAWVSGLIPGGQRLVVAPDSWVLIPGEWVLRIWAILEGDLHPEDNVILDTFCVRPGPTYRVVVESIWANGDTFHPGDTVVVRAIVANLGSGPAMCWCYLKMWDSAAVRHSESLNFMLGSGGRIMLSFPVYCPVVLGTHVARCSVCCVGSADCRDDTFSVVPAGVEEHLAPSASGLRPKSTVVRGELVLEEGATQHAGRGILLDAAGRRVTALLPGDNDLRRLAPGVYFILERLADGDRRMARVVLTR